MSGTDKFATHKSCRTGKHNPSNLNNSDHIKLALWDMFQKAKKTRGGFKSLGSDWNAIAKRLKEEYGINAKVVTVKTKSGDSIKALKFENGAIIADGAGDGQLDMGDYNFKGAIQDLEKRWGMKADQILSKAKELTKAGLSFEQAIDYLKSGGNTFAALPQLQTMGIPGNFISSLQQFNSFSFANRPFFPIQQISMMFISAWLLASP